MPPELKSAWEILLKNTSAWLKEDAVIKEDFEKLKKVTFINKGAILNYLGEQADKIKSFSLAGIFSFFLAACSCTVIPISASLYYNGAGIGVALLFSGLHLHQISFL